MKQFTFQCIKCHKPAMVELSDPFWFLAFIFWCNECQTYSLFSTEIAQKEFLKMKKKELEGQEVIMTQFESDGNEAQKDPK